MIILKRTKSFRDICRKYVVYIDGKKVKSIKNGQQITFDLNKGTYEVYVRVDWCTSNKLKVTLCEDETIFLKCTHALKGSYKIISFKNLTSARNKYLVLEQVTKDVL